MRAMSRPVPFLLLSAAVSTLTVAAPASAQSRGPDGCRTDAPDAATRIARITARLYPSVLLTRDTTSRSLEARMRALKVPGVSIAVIDGDRVAWSRGFGVRDTSTRAPVTTATRFQAASLSKPIAALGVLRLVQQGRLGLDDDVRTRLRTWQMPASPFLDSGRVTPRLLLTHRAGIAVSGFAGYAQTDAVPTLRQVLDGAAPANHPALRVVRTPGQVNAYSGGGYTVMEQVMEDVSGARFVDLLQREVLTPLGMLRSTYATLSPSERDDIARGHLASGAQVPGAWRTHPEHAAASLWTTSCDYANAVLAMQRAARGATSPLPAALVREMMTLQAPTQGIGVGLKGAPVPFRFSHTGSNVGYKAIMLGYLDQPRGAVVLTNGDGGAELMNELVRAIAEEYGWNDMRPVVRTALVVDSLRLSAAAGRYTRDDGRGVYELTWRDGALFGAPAGRAPQRMYAMQDSAGTLTMGFLFDGELQVVLRRDARGAVTGLQWGSATDFAVATKAAGPGAL
ncbi:MAG: beta-lactamase family protein [Gemmatimonadetes bacterium]|nr:beta-lactamase family protein [Gemmatimonadota bacterium]